MRSPKALVFLASLTLVAGLILFNVLHDRFSGSGDQTSPSQSEGKDGGQQGSYIEVETPSGIERLKAERATFILLSTSNLAYDAQLSVSGYVFGEGEEVDLTLYDANGKRESDLGKAWTDKDGNLQPFSFGITQTLAPGKYTVEAVGQTSGKSATAAFTVRTGVPWVNPSTYSGKPNSAVELAGGGFKPGETVDVHFDSLAADPIDSFLADSQGTLTVTVRVPFTSEGDHSFLIMGETTNSPIRIPFSVLGFNPWGSLDNYSPQPNQAVGFSGHDFVPGEQVRIYFNQLGGDAVATATADEEGNFEIPGAFFPPPEAVGGKNNSFLFVGNLSQTVVPVPFEVLPLTPGLELTTYAGAPGTPVGFIGQGFIPGETLRAYLSNKPEPGKEVSTFSAGEDGSFNGAGTFNIPTGTGSSVAITLIGDKSRSPMTLSFAVLPTSAWANLSVYFGPPGTEVVIDGGGFAPDEPITVHFQERQAPAVLTFQAGTDGSFQKAGPIAVPSTGNENTTILVVGEKSGAEVKNSFNIRNIENNPEGSPPANESPSTTPTETSGETQP